MSGLGEQRMIRFAGENDTTSKQEVEKQSWAYKLQSTDNMDRLHPSYKRRAKSFFFVGKVFSILWAEPAASGLTASGPSEALVQGLHGELIFSKLQRFVVVRTGDTYCVALPIMTYNRRGVAKRGIKKSEHAIIYTGNQIPKLHTTEKPGRDEAGVLSPAIRVEPDTRADELDPTSRINFGHPRTIYHSMKVKSCGKVVASSAGDLLRLYQEVILGKDATHVANIGAIEASREQRRVSDPKAGYTSQPDIEVLPGPKLGPDQNLTLNRLVDEATTALLKLTSRAASINAPPVGQGSSAGKDIVSTEKVPFIAGPPVNALPGPRVMKDGLPYSAPLSQPQAIFTTSEVEMFPKTGRSPPRLGSSSIVDAPDNVSLLSMTGRSPPPPSTPSDPDARDDFLSPSMTDRLPPLSSSSSESDVKDDVFSLANTSKPSAKTAPTEVTALNPTVIKPELFVDDANSITTSGDSILGGIPPEAIQALIQVFVTRLRSNLPPGTKQASSMVPAVLEHVVSIITIFAATLKPDAASQPRHQARRILGKRKRDIAVKLLESDNTLEEPSQKSPTFDDDFDKERQARILKWTQSQGYEDLPQDEVPDHISEGSVGDSQPAFDEFEPENLEPDEPEPDESELDGSELDQSEPDQGRTSPVQYLETLDDILDHGRLDWLTSKLQSAALLSQPHTSITDPSLRLLRALLKPTPNDVHDVGLEIAWDARNYMTRHALTSLLNVVTITSDGQHHQCATVLQYVQQTWPLWGDTILQATNQFLSGTATSTQDTFFVLGPAFQVDFSWSKRSLCVTVSGSVLEVLETIEVLSWLSCACVCSDTVPGNVQALLPVIKPYAAESQTRAPTLGITTASESIAIPEVEGCWRPLFPQVHVAKGFPVRARSQSQQNGLEMTFDLMLELGQAAWATIYDGMFLLKGLTSMFYPLSEDNDCVVWHFLTTLLGRYISHNEGRSAVSFGSGPLQAKVNHLRSVRHFVGWTPEVQSSIATLQAKFDEIQRPIVDTSRDGLVFEKVTVTAGMYVTVAGTIMKGDRQRSIMPKADTWYEDMLGAARKKAVIIYDQRERRAFMVTALEALGHLACARMQSKDFVKSCKSDFDGLDVNQHAFSYAQSEGFGDDSAYDMLLKQSNRDRVFRVKWTTTYKRTWQGRQAVVHREDTPEFYKFEDLVMDTWSILSQLIDLQNKKDYLLRLWDTSLWKLEGWPFQDIIEQTQLVSRLVDIGRPGVAWIEYARSVGAPILLGRGFGDIYKVHNSYTDICPKWRRVPPGNDYLAVRVSLLRANWDQMPANGSHPRLLKHGTRWHQPNLLFEKRNCNWEHCVAKACERLQVMRSARHPGIDSPVSADLLDRHKSAAVIFGELSPKSATTLQKRPPSQSQRPLERPTSPERIREIAVPMVGQWRRAESSPTGDFEARKLTREELQRLQLDIWSDTTPVVQQIGVGSHTLPSRISEGSAQRDRRLDSSSAPSQPSHFSADAIVASSSRTSAAVLDEFSSGLSEASLSSPSAPRHDPSGTVAFVGPSSGTSAEVLDDSPSRLREALLRLPPVPGHDAAGFQAPGGEERSAPARPSNRLRSSKGKSVILPQ